ncbi:TIGR04282 family arsenosugar biosynthesis glycosyltransferase [Halovibrio sp. HP20-50]|uniref:TIGR04282 family arsenosugar biosynthesis glycosyltransferase n=1 Tax=Halovibrio sp. HP20-59 TaxID=3080275 RepID=UPI00294B0C12|nr:TIGR04282 family arsenosugar biosynthesis glycosyltransferase [Halovibrio sp. HP20-59]MEA2118665.1 TIGR04282 family arsenosugar biosynthesis glycosyltransferase [Halovibrio sp. HP20-59]
MPAETPQMHLLAKAPLPGQAKTRLAPLLGSEGAANAHAELVRHCVANACKALPAENITLWTALDHAHPLFIELREAFGLTLTPQPNGDLGARIRYALNSTPGPAMLMGSDCPSISAELITTCARQLASHDVVILPAEDGGYGLIGTQQDYPKLFEAIPWGSERVLSETQQRIEALGLTAAYPATIWDIDRPEDWQRWKGLTAAV